MSGKAGTSSGRARGLANALGNGMHVLGWAILIVGGFGLIEFLIKVMFNLGDVRRPFFMIVVAGALAFFLNGGAAVIRRMMASSAAANETTEYDGPDVIPPETAPPTEPDDNDDDDDDDDGSPLPSDTDDTAAAVVVDDPWPADEPDDPIARTRAAIAASRARRGATDSSD